MVLSRVGYVLLQVGDVEGAGRAFKCASDIINAPENETNPKLPMHMLLAMARRNNGLLLFAKKDLQGSLAP